MADGARTLALTVLGSGTSVGVPTIGCPCAVCLSSDPRNRRLRPSVALICAGRTMVVDTGPDFRQQAIQFGLRRVDAVLLTHAHADHILGLDDLRPFNFHQNMFIPVWAAEPTWEVVRRVFAYVFHEGEVQSSRPRLQSRVFGVEPFEELGFTITPVPLKHGWMASHGFRIGPLAYLTDHSDIPESSLELLAGLDVLFLDALRYRPHPTHSTVEQSLKTVERLRPKQAWFTHISHDIDHGPAERDLPENVRLAYDGLELRVEVPAA
jgi:phosphoribosyl 1,2-cyclic phosphate phosphodiesterase